MACDRCNNNGFITIPNLKDDRSNDTIRPCPFCKDNKAYYRYIKAKYANKSKAKKSDQHTEAKILSFNRLKD